MTFFPTWGHSPNEEERNRRPYRYSVHGGRAASLRRLRERSPLSSARAARNRSAPPLVTYLALRLHARLPQPLPTELYSGFVDVIIESVERREVCAKPRELPVRMRDYDGH